jgi:hypothetical protein
MRRQETHGGEREEALPDAGSRHARRFLAAERQEEWG